MTETAGPDPEDEAASRRYYNYPPRWEADVVVADGGMIHLRPITPKDADAVLDLHARLSARTRYLRYFSAYPTIPKRDLIRFTHMDNLDRVALAAWAGSEIIAIGRFDRLPPPTAPGARAASGPPVRPGREAEVAFVVADSEQGRGIGSVLLEHLAEVARELDIDQFEAIVLAENVQMMRIFLDAGFTPSRHYDGGEVTLEFDIAATPMTEKVIAEREQRAESSSIRRLLSPRSVAVIGASSDQTKIGHLVWANLLRSGFRGPVYRVNPNAAAEEGDVHTDLSEIEGVVDLAVVAVPASTVGSVVAQCGAKGVRGLIVISAGFGESGDEPSRQSGLAAQRSLVGQARAFGMRVVGPNCLGVINTDEAVSLNASLAPLAPPTGRAGFFCQSGALGVAILGEAARRGIGVSTFVSAGNRADVSGNDMLQYWESDPATDIALLYLESFGNPRKFARIARRFARRKPIVAVKSGRGTVVAGLQYTSAQVPDEAVEALFEASGVIRTETLTQLFDVASLLGTQPLPRGDRIAVVGHSTALAVLVADGLSTAGLPLALIIDVGVDASPESFGRQVRAALDSEDVDAVISVFVPPMRRGEEFAVAAQLRDAVVGRDKPLLSVFMGFDGIPAELSVAGTLAPSYGSIPSYPSPERAVGALRHVVRFANWRRREAGSVPQIAGIDTAAAKEFLLQVLRADPTGRELGEQEAQRLLAWYGINVLASTLVTDEHAAVEAAESLGWPVALKLAGAVRLYLHDGRELAEAWRSLGLRASDPAVVQVMAPRGVDTVLTMHDDRSFGSLVSFGVGGLATDLLEDRAYAVVPLTSLDAAELISAPKAFPLLTGYGGADESDLESLVELALRLSALADDLPEVVHCRLDPVVASPSGAHVLSATVRVAPPLGRDRVRARRLGH